MASYDQRAAAEDAAAVEEYRAKFGDEKAAQFAADLYKLRRTPAPAPETPIFGVFPRWTLVLIAIWLALLETAEKLPRLLLAFPGYEATLAEMQAKMMQPQITAAQLAKAQNEAKASTYQPNLAAVQLEKNTYEANATAYAPAKALSEAKAARWQPSIAAAQSYETQIKWLMGTPNDEWKKEGNITISDERPATITGEPIFLRAAKPAMPSIPSDAAPSGSSPVGTGDALPRPPAAPSDKQKLDAIMNGAPAPSAPKPPPVSAPPPPPQVSFDNYDIAGNDITHIDLPTIDACLASCKDNANCQAVTFNKWNRRCFLKSGAETLLLNPAAVSAFVKSDVKPSYSPAKITMSRYPERGFPKTSDVTDVKTKDDCENLCVNTSWCVAETFFRSSHQCMMLKTTGEYFPDGDADSSIKRQAN